MNKLNFFLNLFLFNIVFCGMLPAKNSLQVLLNTSNSKKVIEYKKRLGQEPIFKDKELVVNQNIINISDNSIVKDTSAYEDAIKKTNDFFEARDSKKYIKKQKVKNYCKAGEDSSFFVVKKAAAGFGCAIIIPFIITSIGFILGNVLH